MWPLEVIHHLNSEEQIRKSLTRDLPYAYSNGEDCAPVPYLSEGPGKVDQSHKRLATLKEWTPETLKVFFRENGPFLAAREDDGTLILWEIRR